MSSLPARVKSWPLLLTAVILFVSGFTVGYYQHDQLAGRRPPAGLINTETGQPAEVDFSVFWQTWSVIDNKYVNGTTTASTTAESWRERVYGATQGLVASLGDPYSVFLPPAETRSFEQDIRGDFGGVGIELGVREKELTVISALPGTPARRVGIEAGDRIIKINNTDSRRLPVDEAVRLIRGEVGTKVELVIFRPERQETKNLTIIRERIQIPTIKTELLPAGVFLIQLYNFNANSPYLFRGALREFIEAGTDKLIIDLRGNPGGYLEAAVDMASWFLPEGRIVVKEYHGGRGGDITYRSRGYDIFTAKLKLVILVDGGSASAAEILAGALSEHGVGVLIGENTFGKGSVQELVSLDDGSAVKITTAKWLTPSGASISDSGLKPAIVVELLPEDRTADRDPQLKVAVDYLLNWPR